MDFYRIAWLWFGFGAIVSLLIYPEVAIFLGIASVCLFAFRSRD